MGPPPSRKNSWIQMYPLHVLPEPQVWHFVILNTAELSSINIPCMCSSLLSQRCLLVQLVLCMCSSRCGVKKARCLTPWLLRKTTPDHVCSLLLHTSPASEVLDVSGGLLFAPCRGEHSSLSVHMFLRKADHSHCGQQSEAHVMKQKE